MSKNSKVFFQIRDLKIILWLSGFFATKIKNDMPISQLEYLYQNIYFWTKILVWPILSKGSLLVKPLLAPSFGTIFVIIILLVKFSEK